MESFELARLVILDSVPYITDSAQSGEHCITAAVEWPSM